MSSKRPTVDLALNLLCHNIADKLSQRKHFTTNAPLIYHHLLHLFSEPHQQYPTLLSQYLILDPQVVRFLLHQPGLDSRLTAYCQLLQPSPLPNPLYLEATVQKKLEALVIEDWQKQQPLLLYFQGSDAVGKRNTALLLAQKLKVSLLDTDIAKILEDKASFTEKLLILGREAWFFQQLLYLDNFDLLYLPENQVLYQSFLRELEKNRGIIILTGVENWRPTATGIKGLITVPFTMAESDQRRKCWQNHLQAAQITIDNKELNLLSDRFRLTPDQIADAVATASNMARLQATETGFTDINSLSDNSHLKTAKLKPSFVNLCSAARAQSGHYLATLGRKIEPKYTYDDLVLHSHQLNQLRDICKEAKNQDLVHQKWGFAAKLSLGKGLSVLFSGSPGTGKTMAAEVIAHQLQLDLYKIDLSQIVSKYIGETEKNLNRVFTAATNSNAILLFDEADALFGKRSDVKDAHDRYANIEIGYLLQKMEEYEGIAILATNLRQNMDDAFVRRLHFIVEFPFPDEEYRQHIWEVTFPPEAPLGKDIDFSFLARQVRLPGGNIKNISLAAAFYAARTEESIQMSHLIQATRREYQKLGRTWNEAEWNYEL